MAKLRIGIGYLAAILGGMATAFFVPPSYLLAIFVCSVCIVAILAVVAHKLPDRNEPRSLSQHALVAGLFLTGSAPGTHPRSERITSVLIAAMVFTLALTAGLLLNAA